MPNCVQCKDCGYLTSRDDSGKLTHVGYLSRTNGLCEPLCFIRAYNLADEWTEPEPTVDNGLQIVQRERECKMFTPWMQDYTPKEHRDMNIIEQTIKNVMDRQDRQSNRDRIWQIIFTFLGAAISVVTQILVKWFER